MLLFRASASTRIVLCACLLSLLALPSISQENPPLVHHVSGYLPVQGPHRELAADRPATSATHPALTTLSTAPPANPWQLQATLPGAFVHDLSFPTPTTGFAAAENGQVWGTTDGGASWTQLLNLGLPYEWYGVHAFDANNVILSGFNDQSSNGIVRWSHDGGSTWTGDILLSSTQWSSRVRFANSTQGLVLDSITGPVGHFTTDGGETVSDWTQVETEANGGWNGPEFSLLPDGNTAAAGIKYCTSPNAGQTWTCGPSVDSVFDGPVFFSDNNNGWVGSGEIAPNVEGWIHRTTDGGKTWSSRTLDGPFPIREIFFVSSTMGWAAGGNVFSNIGGIYFSSDGGQTWSLDVDTNGHEMDACDSQPVGGGYQIWCAGFSNASNSAIYTLQGASTPAFSPAPGTFSAVQAVSLSSATPNASIYYTTDGSTPTVSSAVYATSIVVTSTATIQAIAVAPGMASSLPASGLYTITPPQLQFTGNAPSVTVTAGSSASVQLNIQANQTASNVTFSCAGLPAGVQCSFSPTSLTATAQSAPVTLTFSATSSVASAITRRTGAPITLALVFPGFFLLPGAALCARRRNRRLLAGLSLASLIGLAGCGGSSAPSPQPVSATVTVTAVAPGATSATAQVQLTVNP